MALKIFLFFIFFFFSFQQARSEDKANNKKEVPTKIKSNIIDIKRKSQIIDFLGNVLVEKEDSSMLADKMRVFYEEKKKPKSKSNLKKISENKSNENFNNFSQVKINPENDVKKTKEPSAMEESSIKRIDAVGNVKVFTEEYVANSNFGYYDPKNNIFILEKNVTVNNGTSVATGDKFIYDITTKKGNFIGKKDKIIANKNSQDGDSRVVIVIGNDLKDQR